MRRQFLALFFAHLTAVVQVALIANEYLANVVIGEFVYFMHPLADVFKGLAICYVIHNDNSVGTPVITGRQSSESFLARCVPYLQFDVLPIHLYGLYFEIYADGVEKIFIERIFLYTQSLRFDNLLRI